MLESIDPKAQLSIYITYKDATVVVQYFTSPIRLINIPFAIVIETMLL